MKRHLALILSAVMLCSAAACGADKGETGKEDAVSQISVQSAKEEETAQSDPFAAVSVVDQSEDSEAVDPQTFVEQVMEKYLFEGIVYAEKDGKPVAVCARGNDESGKPLTADTPMPIGSVSKQFCAAAILRLAEQKKLSLDDTVGTYFPEYTAAKEVTLKQLLSMRSGVPNFTEELFTITKNDNTDEENTELIKKWIFEKPMDFNPGEGYTYSNSNFMLLGNIVEQVTGQPYAAYLRENFFEPLGMTHTGTISEMTESAQWTGGVSYQHIDLQPGLTKGAGDILSNGADISLWLNALSSGKVITDESYQAMTTNYTEEQGYGYGIRTNFFGGIGHPGSIGSYVALDYIQPEEHLTFFLASSSLSENGMFPMVTEVLRGLRA